MKGHKALLTHVARLAAVMQTESSSVRQEAAKLCNAYALLSQLQQPVPCILCIIRTSTAAIDAIICIQATQHGCWKPVANTPVIP
jgi:hypothetical protein